MFCAIGCIIAFVLGRVRHQIWKALDWDEGGVAGKVCGGLLAFLIVVNSLAVMLETVEEYYTAYRGEFLLLERVSLTLFFIEYAFRVWVAPEGERRVESAHALHIQFFGDY